MRTRSQLRRNTQRGIAALEFAFMAMFVMIPLVLGIWQLGKAISEYDTLVKAVRDGARYLTLYQPGTHAAAARCIVTHGNVDVTTGSCVGNLLLPNLATATITICDAVACPGTHANVDISGIGRVNLATVTISNFRYLSWVPSFLADITFSPISNTMRAPS
jgi:Flp pilus assembly protein TadG